MKYAIIENGIVVNIAIANRPLSNMWIQIPIRASVSIGDTWDGSMFYDQDGNPRITPEANLWDSAANRQS